MRTFMLGLDASGKTTLLYQIMRRQVVTTIPTVGINTETFSYKNVEFEMWDFGRFEMTRVRQRYMGGVRGVQGIIVVLDSADRERIDESCSEVYPVLNEPSVKDAAVLVYANKQVLFRPAIGCENLRNLIRRHDRIYRTLLARPKSSRSSD
jgi:ADP-ribosylation factor protein 1